MKQIICSLLFFLIGLPCQICIGESTWITVEGSAKIVDNDKASAKEQAVQNALNQSIRKAVGDDISAESLWANFRLNDSLAGVIPYVKIVESRVAGESYMKASPKDDFLQPKEYTVTLQVAVEVKNTGHDPDFKINASIQKPIIMDGDDVQISIEVSRNCYIWVFMILEDERVLRLVPNRVKKDNYLYAGKKYLFPNRAEREKGIKLKAHTPENRQSIDEALYILALKQPRNLRMQGMQVGIYNQYVASNKTTFLKDLIEQMVDIPLDQRCETLIRYRIKKS